MVNLDQFYIRYNGLNDRLKENIVALKKFNKVYINENIIKHLFNENNDYHNIIKSMVYQ